MKALPDLYEPLKTDFLLYPKNYAQMSLSELEQKNIQWAASKKLILPSTLPIAMAAAVGCGNPPPTQLKGRSQSSSTGHHDSTHFTQLHTDFICICNRTDGHQLEDCGHLLVAGYVITHDPEQAKAK
jgi:hypothetical protein